MSMKAENVLNFPRPAICEPCAHRLTVEFNGVVIADTTGGYRALETYHPPTYYLPMEDIKAEHLVKNSRRSLCEWKGQASYFDIVVGDKRADGAAWTYAKPTPPFAPIEGKVAFYAEPMERCTVGGVDVIPQPGNFYGGWLTPNIEGPVKGAPGTTHW
ncbi:DUF427 domain-containing protein [Pseudahrensia aquimaris]|uniref:DUF427 domain-containing protein n=1 Tax=Pseudahrensia aquimaris TaxID=744461 RepID=A0ABW3FH58_9HYPH